MLLGLLFFCINENSLDAAPITQEQANSMLIDLDFDKITVSVDDIELIAQSLPEDLKSLRISYLLVPSTDHDGENISLNVLLNAVAQLKKLTRLSFIGCEFYKKNFYQRRFQSHQIFMNLVTALPEKIEKLFPKYTFETLLETLQKLPNLQDLYFIDNDIPDAMFNRISRTAPEGCHVHFSKSLHKS